MGVKKTVHAGEDQSEGWEANRADRIRPDENICTGIGSAGEDPGQITESVSFHEVRTYYR